MQQLLDFLRHWAPLTWFAVSVLGLLTSAEALRRFYRYSKAARATGAHEKASVVKLLSGIVWHSLVVLIWATVIGFLALLGRVDEEAMAFYRIITLLGLLLLPVSLTVTSYRILRYTTSRTPAREES